MAVARRTLLIFGACIRVSQLQRHFPAHITMRYISSPRIISSRRTNADASVTACVVSAHQVIDTQSHLVVSEF